MGRSSRFHRSTITVKHPPPPPRRPTPGRPRPRTRPMGASPVSGTRPIGALPVSGVPEEADLRVVLERGNAEAKALAGAGRDAIRAARNLTLVPGQMVKALARQARKGLQRSTASLRQERGLKRKARAFPKPASEPTPKG